MTMTPMFDPGEPFRREMQKAMAPLRDTLQNAIRGAIPNPREIILESTRLSIANAIQPTVELDLLAVVREEMFAGYRESIRRVLQGWYPDERTAWSDQVVDVASALASADAVVVAAEDSAVIEDLSAAEADSVAEEVVELRGQVAALMTQIAALTTQVSVLVASQQAGSRWSTDRTIALLALLFSVLSFVGDRYDAATEDHAPPPVTAPIEPGPAGQTSADPPPALLPRPDTTARDGAAGDPPPDEPEGS